MIVLVNLACAGVCAVAYAGRDQIPHSTAAGKRKADGGQTRDSGRSEIYTLRISSIGNDDNTSYQTCPALGSYDSTKSCSARTACQTRCSDRSQTSRADNCCRTACRASRTTEAHWSSADSVGLADGCEIQKGIRLGH